MKLNRALQRRILEQLADKFPGHEQTELLQGDASPDIA